MNTKISTSLKLLGAAVLVPVQIVLCLIGASIIMVVPYFAGIGLGWIHTTIEPFMAT